MGGTMKRGEVWLGEVGKRNRPVLLLTRSEVLDARSLVTVAEIAGMRTTPPAVVSLRKSTSTPSRSDWTDCRLSTVRVSTRSCRHPSPGPSPEPFPSPPDRPGSAQRLPTRSGAEGR